MNKAKKILSVLLTLTIVLSLVPAFTITARADDVGYSVVIDLSAGSGSITVSPQAHETVLIKGNGSIGRTVRINNATQIFIATGTQIRGSEGSTALIVPDGATVTGLGNNINITAGSASFGGTSGHSPGSQAITSVGSITLAGTIGNIHATSAGGSTSPGGRAISVIVCLKSKYYRSGGLYIDHSKR